MGCGASTSVPVVKDHASAPSPRHELRASNSSSLQVAVDASPFARVAGQDKPQKLSSLKERERHDKQLHADSKGSMRRSLSRGRGDATTPRGLTKTASGKEGRHGFVPPSTANRNGPLTPTGSAADPLHSGAHAAGHAGHAGEGSTILGVLARLPSYLTRPSTHDVNPAPDKDDTDAVVLDVPFVFKKALEVKRRMTITHDDLASVVQSLVDELDPGKTGEVQRSALVQTIQGTCTYANMASPTEEQILEALPMLARHDKLSTALLYEALMSMQWSLQPLLNRRSTAS